ncbi:hypothetical protein ATANTOWER_019197 [Ataeniobius toweri]|uniref:Uncharacterized protein n=1 Tax=Ataeniobius toweri TaxID=208326 RepID=A0ABU7BJH3_9TELE|nr:hypothetical protein [Ataeniobius toweri]
MKKYLKTDRQTDRQKGGRCPVSYLCWSQARLNADDCVMKSIRRKTVATSPMQVKNVISIPNRSRSGLTTTAIGAAEHRRKSGYCWSAKKKRRKTQREKRKGRSLGLRVK